MRVTIIGAGLMGRGIGMRLVAGGNDVEVIDTDPEQARSLAQQLESDGGRSVTVVERGGTIGGEVVILAIAYPAIAGAVAEYGDQLTGKVVVDIANPVDFDTMDGLATPPDSSSAEETAQLAPAGTSVVKAFNTTFGNTLASGEAAGQKLDVLIAGDDEEAKETVAKLVTGGGLRPMTWDRCAALASSSSSGSCISGYRTAWAPASAAPSSSCGEQERSTPRS